MTYQYVIPISEVKATSRKDIYTCFYGVCVWYLEVSLYTIVSVIFIIFHIILSIKFQKMKIVNEIFNYTVCSECFGTSYTTGICHICGVDVSVDPTTHEKCVYQYPWCLRCVENCRVIPETLCKDCSKMERSKSNKFQLNKCVLTFVYSYIVSCVWR